jgi:hypothetical protein
MSLTPAQLQQKLTYANKRVAFAWAKYYEAKNADHHGAVSTHTTLTTTISDPHIPTHIKATLTEMATALKKKWECPVCLDMIEEGHLAITNCGHIYCDDCLETLKAHARASNPAPDAKWECSVCRRKHKFSGDD